jgi:hypothetical protein
MRLRFLCWFLLSFIVISSLNIISFAGWSTPVRISEPGGGYYPQIIAQGDTLHAIYTNSRGRSKVCYLRSTNGGTTWSQQMMISDTINSGSPEYPNIILSRDRLMVLWRVYRTQGPYHENISYSISDDNGFSWSIPGYVLSNNRQWGFVYAASGEDSLINIVASCSPNDTAAFYNVRSTNFGQNWSSPQMIFRINQSGLPDCASIGHTIHFVWDGRFDPQHHVEIYYTKSLDGGISWLPNIPLSDTDQFHSQMPSISADSFGNIGASWMDYKYSPYTMTGDILTRQSIDSGLTWGPERQATYNHFALGANDMVIDGDTIHIVWNDGSEGLNHRSIFYSRSTDNGVSWSEPYWIDGTLDDSHDPAMAISNGKAYIIWYDMQLPDSSGLYFSRYDPRPDAIGDRVISNFPQELSLSAYPNPFNSTTTLTVEGIQHGKIEIYDITGRMVAMLETSNCKAVWDASGFSSGVYFARVIGAGSAQPKRLVLLK